MLDKVHKYHMMILLDFNAKLGKEDFFTLTIWNESLHETSNDNRVIHLALSENFTVRNSMFPYCNIHKYTWMSPDGKT
jgi:hypothetical protein